MNISDDLRQLVPSAAERSAVIPFRLAIFSDHAIAITDEPVPCGICGRSVTLL